MTDSIERTGTGARVLVVDDDATVRELVSAALAGERYVVHAAPHGGVALDLIRRWPPDVILLDMSMPIMDGRAFAQAYRETPGPHAPIIALTASTYAEERAAQINADGVLGKPFTLEDLFRTVGRYAMRRHLAPLRRD